MKKNNNGVNGNSLHPKMEELVKEVLFNKFLQVTGCESQKMLQDLKMQKVALELQNEELKKTILQLVSAFKKYTELNDFETSAFFSISREGKILELNRNAFHLLGKDQFRAKDNLFEIFIPEENRESFHHFLNSLFTNGKVESCETTLNINDNPETVVHLTGVVTRSNGQCLLGVFNITGQKEWEENLHRNEVRLQTLAQMIPDLGWIKDSYEVILSCNKELEKLFAGKGKVLNNVFGFRGAAIIEKRDFDFVDQDLIGLIQQRSSAVLQPEKKKTSRKKRVLSILS